MKKNGFTLIELLIVTVVIVTLMGTVFRLAGAGGDSRKKAVTLKRMQCIENAISGYYAAYGSYPPVPLQGRSRNINVRVDENGVQGPPTATRNVNLSSPTDEDVKQIDAACRAQPLAVLFPFFMADVNSEKKSDAEQIVSLVASQSGASFSALKNIGALDLDKTDWHEIELFQFGLLSFLLPRYQFMLQGDEAFYDHTLGGSARRIGQWASNNQLPCRPDTGRTYESWKRIQDYLYSSGSQNTSESAIIENINSQAVCARWMPNFEKIITGGLTFYGVDTSDGDRLYLQGKIFKGLPEDSAWMHQFSTGGFESNTSLYLLNGMTIVDGWNNDFYYSSEPPYQSYRLWSAGPGRRTFPPWYDLSSFSTAERATIANWTKDDLSHLSN